MKKAAGFAFAACVLAMALGIFANVSEQAVVQPPTPTVISTSVI
ncbi:hypothetical protein OS242_15115 [Tumebacillus sp. DT12]|uniref:Uncharacterized protein n=1 Tax=Tumebacillus lacus TaxID=2995335 RepID=A0ABT3X6J8_9BACL|nr:hypothetical protein [Tumebacillus lacus]MCX7571281.1 hypothetical protein [Tumebacillus lacus]